MTLRLYSVFTPMALCGLMLMMLVTGCGEKPVASSNAVDTSAPKASALSPKEAIAKAHTYLAGTHREGKWGATGITAFVSLGLAATGADPNGEPLKSGLAHLEAHVQDDGSIHDGRSKNYTTSLAILALHRSDKEKYKTLIANGQKYLKGIQVRAGQGVGEDPIFVGGIGYGGDTKPDLSNLHMALEALKETDTPDAQDTYAKAMAFINRTQNRSESNDMPWAANDGGFVYSPDLESAQGPTTVDDKGIKRATSYGSMTFAGIKSLVFCNVSKDDPRITDAVGWIEKNFSVDEHPNMGSTSLFYYYATMAKALDTLGIEVLKTPKGPIKWREALRTKLLALQNADGSWANDNKKFFENVPPLATGYALYALSYCK